MFDKAQLRGKSLPASMLLDCKYRYFCLEIQKTSEKKVEWLHVPLPI